MNRRSLVSAAVLVGLAATAVPAAARPIAERVAAIEEGWLVFSFAARDGSCHDHCRGTWHRSDDPVWEPRPERCDAGPLRVALRIGDGGVVELDTHVGGRWRAGVAGLVDLGLLEPAVAVDYLLDLAHLAGDDAQDLAIREAAIFALSQLDDEERAVDELVAIVHRSRHPRLVEKALFWLADTGSPRAIDVIEEILLGR